MAVTGVHLLVGAVASALWSWVGLYKVNKSMTDAIGGTLRSGGSPFSQSLNREPAFFALLGFEPSASAGGVLAQGPRCLLCGTYVGHEHRRRFSELNVYLF